MVARRSPQTERVIGILNHLAADESGEGITLSEIAPRLGVSKAACYPMLEALVEAGYLSRHATRKTFNLGPALVAIGMAASRRNPQRERARQAMVRLSERLDLSAWLYGADGTHLRVIDQAWRSRKVSPILHVGERFSFRPPNGTALMAWASPRQVKLWLDSANFSDTIASAYIDLLAAVRQRGYAVALEQKPVEDLRVIVRDLANATTPSERAGLLERFDTEGDGRASVIVDPDPDETYLVKAIDAPIFDDERLPSLAVGVINLPPLSGRRINELARAVSAAALEASIA
jgi:DNA-binding IclR family transcriptional regulator